MDEIKLNIDEETYKRAVRDCEEQMAAIANLDGLTIERRGVWVWVTGNTRKHHTVIKGAGFNFAPKKQAWFWKPKYIESTKKSKPASMKYIRETWANDSAVLTTEEESA